MRLVPWLLACLPLLASAAVTRVRVVERTDVLAGVSTGPAGPYERITATAHFAVDPSLPANRPIADIALAPRNGAKLVEFSADLHVLKPRDPAKSNGTILFEVPNRGSRSSLARFNLATVADEFGDRFLLEQGYTLAWLGWQWDVPNEPNRLRLHAPSALQDGQPLRGLVRSDFVPDAKAYSFPLADASHQPYPAAQQNEPNATLTVRDRVDGPRRVIPRRDWLFARDEQGSPVPDTGHVFVRSGLQPGRIYEVVYTTQGAPLVGLGPAAIRDLISFLKYGTGSDTLLGDQRRFQKRAIGYGISQSGRFLRKFLYDGFNADEKGRIVFDAVWAHVAGAGRGSFNHRFAQASRDARPFLNFDYPTDLFPFNDLESMDPATSQRDALLARATAAKVVPKIFYVNSAYEYWGRAATLIHVTPDGRQDAPLPPTTRVYFLAGQQHFPGRIPPAPATGALHLANPNTDVFIERALLVALHDWLKDGTEPPPSRYPRIDRDELVTPRALNFPKLPGVAVPTRPLTPYRLDFGPQFSTASIVTQDPPRRGQPYPVLVPQVNADGNETAGVRTPELQVPLATITGWNLRDPKLGAPGEMASFVGSYLPFARTKADRLRTRDPRLSLEERYPAGRSDYELKLRAAAEALVRDRFLLSRDTDAVVARALRLW